jgi:hypothetical protein
LESLKGRDHSENLGVDERIILKWILRKLCGSVWIGFVWLRIGTGDELMNSVMNLRVP